MAVSPSSCPPIRFATLYSLRGTRLPPDRPPRYNGAPGQDFTACRVEEDGTRAIALLRWGLVPSWALDARTGSRLINVRAETVHDKPSFRTAFRSRRCLLPADGWFEWQRGPGAAAKKSCAQRPQEAFLDRGWTPSTPGFVAAAATVEA